MTNALLTLLLTLQLARPMPASCPRSAMITAQPQPVLWGLIDPELSLWFARHPQEADHPLYWDWSLRGFFAALFPQSLVKEADHAPAV